MLSSLVSAGVWEKFFGGIPLKTGLSAESGWFTAYGAGTSGRRGENVGECGSTWEDVGAADGCDVHDLR